MSCTFTYAVTFRKVVSDIYLVTKRYELISDLQNVCRKGGVRLNTATSLVEISSQPNEL